MGSYRGMLLCVGQTTERKVDEMDEMKEVKDRLQRMSPEAKTGESDRLRTVNCHIHTKERPSKKLEQEL